MFLPPAFLEDPAQLEEIFDPAHLADERGHRLPDPLLPPWFPQK